MAFDLKRMDEAYGRDWHYYMPPQADPWVKFENFRAPNASLDDTQHLEYKSVKYTTRQNEVLVLHKYGCIAHAAVINDEWPGRIPVQLSPLALQGRFSWVINTGGDGDKTAQSVLGTVTYQNTNNFAALPNGKPYSYEGVSVFTNFVVGDGYPPIIIEPGKQVHIAVMALADDRALDPPPEDDPDIVLLSEIAGYRLKLPWITPDGKIQSRR